MWCSHRWLKSLFNSNEDKHLQEHPTREREKEREKETERKRQRERDRERSSNRGGFARLVILVSPGMQGQGVLSKALATGRTHVGLLAGHESPCRTSRTCRASRPCGQDGADNPDCVGLSNRDSWGLLTVKGHVCGSAHASSRCQPQQSPCHRSHTLRASHPCGSGHASSRRWREQTPCHTTHT